MKINLGTKITGTLALASAGVMFTGIEMDYLGPRILADLDRERQNSGIQRQYNVAI